MKGICGYFGISGKDKFMNLSYRKGRFLSQWNRLDFNSIDEENFIKK